MSAARFEPLGTRKADERVASKTLAADDGFEQIAVGPTGQLHIYGERGVEIGARFRDERNAGEAKRCEPIELGLSHESLRYRLLGLLLRPRSTHRRAARRREGI